MTGSFIGTVSGPDTAYLFPGQGSQEVGMGKDLYTHSPAARKIFDEIDTALTRPLTKLMFEGPDEELRQTINAQPAIMAVSLACIKAMEEQLDIEIIPNPVVMAGHSLGEYTALAVAGVLDVTDTAKLVQLRGKLMQQACIQNPGTMASIIGLDQMIVTEIVSGTGAYVSNINTTEQIVISGNHKAVSDASDLLSKKGARKVIPLRVGGAFHSGLMEPAKYELEQAIHKLTFQDSNIPIIANCSAKPIVSVADIKHELVSQICGCVHWHQSIDYMIKSGISNFIEVGPGKAINGMVRRIDKSVNITSVNNMETILNLSFN